MHQKIRLPGKLTFVFLTLLLLILVTTASSILPFLISKLIFRPLPLNAVQANPHTFGLSNAKEVRFKTADQINLHGWWFEPLSERNCGTVLVFHGRSGNISSRASTATWLARLGYKVFMFDYRGYGASEAVMPTEAGLYLDSEAAYNYVATEQGVSSDKLFLLGQSMGTAMAAHVAAEKSVAGLILISPLRNAPALARTYLPDWLPAAWLDWKNYSFDVQARLQGSVSFLLIAASSADEQVPTSESRTLFDQAPEPKQWIEVDSVGHNGLLQSAAMQAALESEFKQLCCCK